MTSDNVTEAGPVKAAEPQPAKGVDDQLIDELVGRAQAEGLQFPGRLPSGSATVCRQSTAVLSTSADAPASYPPAATAPVAPAVRQITTPHSA
jgi:hypothetical protein